MPHICRKNREYPEWRDYFLKLGEMPVFGYGSLMWKPNFDHDGHVFATALGVARRYCIVSKHYRGTPEYPGRVLGLVQTDADQVCSGCLYTVRDKKISPACHSIWQREMISNVYVPCLISVTLQDSSTQQAWAFLADPEHEQYCDESPAASAKAIAKAHGSCGSNRDYFFDTYNHLQTLHVQDDYLEGIAACLRQNH